MNYRIEQLRIMTKNFLNDVYTDVYTLFHRRDKGVWLFGAWMGSKFTDNTRYLFQYLHEHGSEYGIRQVIWATRNKTVLEMLKNEGYHACLIGTPESKHCHLKAGVHLICNSDGNNGNLGDISTEYSSGAVKIQLWHGTGIKASGNLRNTRPVNPVKDWLYKRTTAHRMTPGHWYRCYFLTTSDESQRVIMADNGISQGKIIRAAYPRLCRCVRHMAEEAAVIEYIKGLKKEGARIILYLPTFRKEAGQVVMPEEIDGFDSFLEKNGLFWLGKKHFADTENWKNEENNRKLLLDSDFDINVIYPYIDLLVTDYSSAASDVLFWGKPTVEYCPDYALFKEADRGFVAPFEWYHIAAPVQSSDQLFDAIMDRLENPDRYIDGINRVRSFLFEDRSQSYDAIVKKIMKKIKLLKGGN